MVSFFFQAGLWASQGIAKPQPTIGLLLELISLGEFGGGDVVYNGTAVVHPNQRVKGYAVYPRYRPTARSRWKPIWAQVQRGVGGHRLNFLWKEDVNKGLKMVLFYIVFKSMNLPTAEHHKEHLDWSWKAESFRNFSFWNLAFYYTPILCCMWKEKVCIHLSQLFKHNAFTIIMVNIHVRQMVNFIMLFSFEA